MTSAVDLEGKVPIICKQQVEGCERCFKEAAYRATMGHECGESVPGKFVTHCEVWGTMKAEDEKFHENAHEPVRCEKCKGVLHDKVSPSRELRSTCWAHMCTVWRCPECRHETASMGPINCPACGSFYQKPCKISDMRRSYHRRRGGRW